MMPGVLHCGGGPGPDRRLARGDRELGREGQRAGAISRANERRRSDVSRTRPLCAYPQQAEYKGQADRRRGELCLQMSHAADFDRRVQ